MDLNLSLNENIINKDNPGAFGWHNAVLTNEELQEHICKGFAWSGSILKDGYNSGKKPSKNDVIGSELLGLDIDNKKKGDTRVLTEEEGYFSYIDACDDPFIIDNALMLYKSFSSGDGWDRFRIVFKLPRLFEKVEFEELSKALISLFNADDTSNIERFWYGNSGKANVVNYGNVLRDDSIDNVLQQYQERTEENKPKSIPVKHSNSATISPVDDYNLRGDVRALLVSNGWHYAYSRISGDRNVDYWRRPGKQDRGISATWNFVRNKLFVWSSSTVFPARKSFNPFAIYTYLNFGDMSEPSMKTAVQQLAAEGYGSNGVIVSNSLANDGEVVSKETGEIIKSNIKFSVKDLLKHLKNNELGDAELFKAKYKNNYLFNFSSDVAFGWHCYQDGVWAVDAKKKITIEVANFLKDTYLQLYNELHIQEMGFLGDGDNKSPDYKNIVSQLDMVKRRLIAINSIKRIKNILEFGQALLPAVQTDFDVNPMELNCKNGVLNLENFQLSPHDPNQRLMKMAGANYDPEAKCEQWLEFLNKIFEGKQDLIEYIQILFGSFITGNMDAQDFYFFYGSGANGKSTLLNCLQLLLNGSDDFGQLNANGGYYKKIHIDTLLINSNNSQTSQYSLAGLQGTRVAVASEMPQGARLNTSLVKEIRGGEVLAVRQIFGKPFNFKPTCKLIFFGNVKPNIRDKSDGLWRSLKMIPFNYRIPNNEQKPQSEMMGIFRREIDGILNWAVQGLKIGNKNPIKHIPASVETAIKDYRSESDILEEFFQDMQKLYNIDQNDQSLKIEGITFWNLWQKWCNDVPEERNNDFKSTRGFYKSLREKGYQVKKATDNKTFVFGIGEEAVKNELLF